MRIKINPPVTFVIISASVFMLAGYLLATKTSLHPQLLIAACGEVLKNLAEHVHFDPEGVISSLILFVTLIGSSLALWQLIKFLLACRKHYQLEAINEIPDKLQRIINKHGFRQGIFLVVSSEKLTAYTTGLFKPQIIVSSTLVKKLSKKQLEAVALHEFYHLRNLHVLWLLVSRLVSSLFFFIPLIAHLAKQLKIEFELAADNFVVKEQRTKEHLCDSLALNLQYAGGAVPHFATSPIEKRVESLMGSRISFEQIGIKSLVMSLFSLMLMLGIAFAQPNQVAAEFAFEVGGVCSSQESCKNTDCSSHETKGAHNFSRLSLSSFSLSSSY